MSESNPRPPYQVLVTGVAKREISALPKDVQKRVDSQILKLAGDPRPPGVRKLMAQRNRYRVRTGDYRIIYEISDEQLIVLIVTVGHRKDVYGH